MQKASDEASVIQRRQRTHASQRKTRHGLLASQMNSAIVLTTPNAGRELVSARCVYALRAGVRVGMDLAQARSMLPPRARVVVQPHEPARVATSLHALACWCLRYTPLVCVDGVDGLMMDIHGTDAVHRTEASLAKKVRTQLNRLGFAVRVAIASSFAGAWALSRFGERAVSVPDPAHEQSVLNELPIAALALDADTLESLHAVGVEHIGELAVLPRGGILARFDRSLLLRLDAMRGSVIEPRIDPVVPEVPIAHTLVFDGPTTHKESIEVATRKVLDVIVHALAQRCQGVRRLHVRFVRPKLTVEPRPGEGSGPSFYATVEEVASSECFDVMLSRAGANAKHLWKLIHTKMDRLDTGLGVEAVGMTVTRAASLRHVQTQSVELGSSHAADSGASDSGTNGGLSEFVDAVVARLGPNAVQRIEFRESHLPEHSFRYVPALESDEDWSRASVSGRMQGSHAEATSTLHPQAVVAPDRPSILYPKPEVATAMALTPDGPLLSLQWRGATHRIISCIGPERISSEWWRWGNNENTRTHASLPTPPPPDRDYFAAQTDAGRWLFVCRQLVDAKARWLVQGEWA
ncbi:MAG: DNA polymerase Y family protein [Phycisphaerales bacterium]